MSTTVPDTFLIPGTFLIRVVTGGQSCRHSSPAFDTLYAQGQRRYVETLSPFLRQFPAKLDQADADRIEGSSTALCQSTAMA